MKKFKKIFLRVLPIVLVAVILVGSSVFGLSDGKVKEPTAGNNTTAVTSLTNKVWGTVVVVVQVLAIAAMVFAGLRYMFTSADEKADIKGQTVTLMVGAALIFAAPLILDFVRKISSDMLR